MEPVPASAVPGTRLGRYTLLGKLATGGMAEVYLARQDGPQGFAKTVVIKKILPHFVSDASFVQMFLNEARLAALINHPNVVSIYELGEDQAAQTYYMAMEYIDGCNLKRLAQGAYEQRKPIAPTISARMVADAAAGLDYAHNLKGEGQRPLNIVHRDVSPENILITYSGLVKVVDFGIAKAAYSETKTRTGQIKGKIGYMSPEQVLGQEIDRRTDVWALGVTLYWLVSGVKPFRGENEAAVIHQIISSEQPPLPQSIPAELQRIVARALQKDKERRYPTGAALQLDLEQWLALSGQSVNSSVVAGYMNSLFPEATDPDRLLTRAILSGELRQMLGQQNTPSNSMMGPRGSMVKTVTNSPLPPAAKGSPRYLLAAGVGAVILLAGGLGAWALRGQGDTGETTNTPLVADPDPAPLPPPPPPPSTGLTQTVAPAGPSGPAVHPRPGPVGPVRTPHRCPSGQVLHRGHCVRVPPLTLPSVVVAPPQPAPEPEPPVPSGPPGKVVVRVLPWASVYIDGRMVGTTPFEPVEVHPGRHKVELRNDELGTKRTLFIDVKPGEQSIVQEKLE